MLDIVNSSGNHDAPASVLVRDTRPPVRSDRSLTRQSTMTLSRVALAKNQSLPEAHSKRQQTDNLFTPDQSGQHQRKRKRAAARSGPSKERDAVFPLPPRPPTPLQMEPTHARSQQPSQQPLPTMAMVQGSSPFQLPFPGLGGLPAIATSSTPIHLMPPPPPGFGQGYMPPPPPGFGAPPPGMMPPPPPGFGPPA